jgi:hypothetical protein
MREESVDSPPVQRTAKPKMNKSRTQFLPPLRRFLLASTEHVQRRATSFD